MKVSSKEVLGLYRSLLRYGQQLKLTDQTYYKERVRQEFRTNQILTSQEKIEFFFKVKAFSNGKEFFKMFRLMTLFKTVVEPAVAKATCRFKFTPDTSKFPTLREEDLTEEFMRGSGPGGQSVAKTNNCVQLKHIPSGIVVRCHESRSVDQNRKIARVRLLTRLDNVLNGEDSVEAQIKRENKRKKEINDAVRKEKLEKKRQFKEREGLIKK